MSFQKLIHRADQFLENFDFQAAAEALDQIQTTNQTQERVRRFYWGRWLLRQGRTTEAIECFVEAIEKCGSHVAL